MKSPPWVVLGSRVVNSAGVSMYCQSAIPLCPGHLDALKVSACKCISLYKYSSTNRMFSPTIAWIAWIACSKDTSFACWRRIDNMHVMKSHWVGPPLRLPEVCWCSLRNMSFRVFFVSCFYARYVTHKSDDNMSSIVRHPQQPGFSRSS